MEECIFPIEILENIAACDVFVAYTIRSTCRELRTLRTQAPPKEVNYIYRNFTHRQFTRIAYIEASGNMIDYFNFGDWHVHNYCQGSEYYRITIYNHRLHVYDIKDVTKKRFEYRTTKEDKLVLLMDPKLLSKYGFDYKYYVDGVNGIKYRIKLIVRPDESRATWTYY